MPIMGMVYSFFLRMKRMRSRTMVMMSVTRLKD